MGIPPEDRACECEIATIAVCRATSAKIRRGLRGEQPWFVVTTSGRRIPRRAASSGPGPCVMDNVYVSQRLVGSQHVGRLRHVSAERLDSPPVEVLARYRARGLPTVNNRTS